MPSPTPQHTVNVFSVPVDDRPIEYALALVESTLAGGRKGTIATVNPEILLEARRNPAYRDVLNDALLRMPDGAGLQRVAGATHRVTGVQLTNALLQEAADQGYAVLAVVWSGGRSESVDVVKAMEQYIHPHLVSIVEIDDRKEIRDADLQLIHDQIVENDVRIILCGIGFPYQETLLSQIEYSTLEGAEDNSWIGIGIGGTFDYLTGAAARPPRALSAMGMEWLWRLLTHPSRWRRIVRAVVVFPLLFWWSRLFGRNKHL